MHVRDVQASQNLGRLLLVSPSANWNEGFNICISQFLPKKGAHHVTDLVMQNIWKNL